MCLSRITNKNPKAQGKGWKVFYFNGWYQDGVPSLFGEYFSKVKPRPVGKWLREQYFRVPGGDRIRTDVDNQVYPFGWHIYVSRPKITLGGEPIPSHFAIRRVRYRKAVVRGIQSRKSVVVAKEIFIEP